MLRGMAITPSNKYWSVRIFENEDEVIKFIGEKYSKFIVGDYVILYSEKSNDKNVYIEDKYFNGNVSVFRHCKNGLESINNKIASGDILKIRNIFYKCNNN